ncbi:unnamed protein product [Cyprideis torosa]|uniref:Dipeptidase n=1 Tax=Cyprideis torosa TaxID=163714 RepID=A0A7R8ZGU6_9CRUS|nr:unnamed protein product [Cyprideis torosa]CAG0881062.1 unnamed protein product [Cyprideis torosa]
MNLQDLRNLASKRLVLIGAAIASVFLLVIILVVTLSSSDDDSSQTNRQRVTAILKRHPLIDGHNDLPWGYRTAFQNQLRVDLSQNLTDNPIGNQNESMTDIPRLRAGMVGAQFWVSFVPCNFQYHGALRASLQQIDLIKRIVANYSSDLQLATSTQGIRDAFRAGKIASLIAVEGGHMMENSLAVLRIYYEIGVRYMTLTWNCDTPWAEYHSLEEKNHQNFTVTGLSEWGKLVIREMNRLGMMIDLSHVHSNTMKVAIEVSDAPVIFSHSSVRELCNSSRNVPDEVIDLMDANGGIIMVNFYSGFVNCNSSRDAVMQDVIVCQKALKTSRNFQIYSKHYLIVVTGRTVRDNKKNDPPIVEWIPEDDLKNHTCFVTD